MSTVDRCGAHVVRVRADRLRADDVVLIHGRWREVLQVVTSADPRHTYEEDSDAARWIHEEVTGKYGRVGVCCIDVEASSSYKLVDDWRKLDTVDLVEIQVPVHDTAQWPHLRSPHADPADTVELFWVGHDAEDARRSCCAYFTRAEADAALDAGPDFRVFTAVMPIPHVLHPAA